VLSREDELDRSIPYLSLNLQFLSQVILTTILTLLGIYAMYSTKRYFGRVRAAGADHFDPFVPSAEIRHP